MTELRPETVRTKLRQFVLCLYVNLAIWLIEWSLVWAAPKLQRFGIRPFSPMADWVERFSDLTHFLARSAQFGRPGMLTRPDLELPFPYPLPAIYIFLPFVKLMHRPLFWYVVSSIAAYALIACFLAWVLYRARPSRSVQALFWGVFLFMHPFWFLVNRGNIEVYLWFFVTVAIICFVLRKNIAAAALFGLIGSMKIYPALLLLLFLKRKDYRALGVGIGVTIATTALTYWIAGPTILQAMHDMQRSATFLNETQVAVVQEKILRWDHSLFGFLKQAWFYLLRVTRHTPEWEISFRNWTRPYALIATALFAAAYILRIRKMPLFSQTTALLIVATLLPYVSYEYTIPYMAVVYAGLLLYTVQQPEQTSPLLTGRLGASIGICFGILFSPITNLALRHFGGQVKCLCLLFLLACVMRYPLPSRLFGDERQYSTGAPATVTR